MNSEIFEKTHESLEQLENFLKDNAPFDRVESREEAQKIVDLMQYINKEVPILLTEHEERLKENDYRILANNKDNPTITKPCIDCSREISFDKIAEEVKEGSLQEVICQNCWEIE